MKSGAGSGMQVMPRVRFIREDLMIVVRILIFSFLICYCSGCNYSYSPTVSTQFTSFLETEGDTLSLPSGEQVTISSLFLQKELSESRPKVVLIWFYNGPLDYFLEQIKAKQDIKVLCKKVIQFADSAAWKNDYYLYAQLMHRSSSLRIVFDYEHDTFFFPDNHSLLRQTINQFDTVDPLQILNMEGGKRFLRQNGVVRIRHDKTEIDTTAWDRKFWTDKMVYINRGEFICIE